LYLPFFIGLFNPYRYFFFFNAGGLPSWRCPLLTPANPDAAPGAIMAPDGQVRLALNPYLARQFLEVLYSRYYSLTTCPAYLEVRGKREGAGMSFRRFFATPEALIEDMSTWDPDLNYWVGIALRRNTQGGKKENLSFLTTAFGDVDCGTAGHKIVNKYSNKAEALAALERFTLKPSALIDSGGGYQPYWLLRAAVDLNNGNLERLERINRGLAVALGGDVAATDAARILRLPGTYNMKLAGNPRPVEIVWCDPSRVYDLAELAKYEAKPQGTGQGKRQAQQGGTGAGSGGDYAPYAQKALGDELAKLARTTTDRNIQLNLSAFALGQLVGAGVLERGSVEAALQGVAASIGLTGAEIRATIRSGLESGMQQPRQLPEKQSRNGKQKQKKTVPPLIKKLDIAATYAQETGLKLLQDPPEVDKNGFTPCSVLYCPEDPSHTAFINIGQGERRGYYLELKAGQQWRGGNLCQTIAAKGSGPYMTPKDVYTYLEKKLGQTVKRQTPSTVGKDTTKPIIFITDRYLDGVANDAINALETANTPPFLFRRSGNLVRIFQDEKNTPKIIALNDVQLRGVLARHALFMRETKAGSFPTSPPMDAVKDILHLGDWTFPALEGIVQSPVLRPDGTILVEPGYDHITHLYYVKPAELTIPDIAEKPSDSDVEGYLGYLSEAIRDFPFVEDADRANALALLMSLPLRPTILGSVPMAAITKPTPGTGASLFVDAVAIIGTGKVAPMAGLPRDDDEMRKYITSRLIAGDPLVSFDNLELPLWSPSLCRALTCHEWEDRVLGQSVTVRLPQKAVWIANGNNLKLRGDLPRRTYPIRFDARLSKPWEREHFRHPDLCAWVRRWRGDLLAAILTIARAWFVAGKPKPLKPLPVLGGFEEWVTTIGGILAFAGVKGFLENLAQFHDEADIEGPEWEGFLSAWVEIIGDIPKTCQEIAAIIRENSGFASTLPDNLQDILKKPEKSFERSLGRALARKEKRPYGENSWALQRVGTDKRAVLWRVAPL
jgi:hypothetical protein